MLDEPVDVCKGDRIVGSVTLERNKIWRRHLTVHITAKHESACDGDAIQVNWEFLIYVMHALQYMYSPFKNEFNRKN